MKKTRKQWLKENWWFIVLLIIIVIAISLLDYIRITYPGGWV